MTNDKNKEDRIEIYETLYIIIQIFWVTTLAFLSLNIFQYFLSYMGDIVFLIGAFITFSIALLILDYLKGG